MDKDVRKQRRNTQVIVAATACVMSILLFIRGNILSGSVMLAAVIPSYFLCAFYLKILYKFSLRNHVTAIYRKSTPREVSVIIRNEEEIEYNERGLTKKVKIADLEEISDIKSYFYLKLGETSYIIIPKQELSDPAYIEKRLQYFAEKHQVTFIYNPAWRWH